MESLMAINTCTMGVRLYVHTATAPIYVGEATPGMIDLAHMVGLYDPVWHPGTMWIGGPGTGKLFVRAASLIGPICIGMDQLEDYVDKSDDFISRGLLHLSRYYLYTLVDHPTAYIYRKWVY